MQCKTLRQQFSVHAVSCLHQQHTLIVQPSLLSSTLRPSLSRHTSFFLSGQKVSAWLDLLHARVTATRYVGCVRMNRSAKSLSRFFSRRAATYDLLAGACLA